MVLILHERKAQEYRGHEAEDRKLIQSCIQCYWEVNLAFLRSTGSHIFLVIIGAHLIIPNVCYLFLGLRRRLSKGKRTEFKSGGRGKGEGEGKGTLLIFPSHARTRKPLFRRPVTQTILFLNSLLRCPLRLFFVPRHYRTIGNQSKYKY